MRKVYLDWNHEAIIWTTNINDINEGCSIRFNDKNEMYRYIKENKNEFENEVIYDQITTSNVDGTFIKQEWVETSLNLI